MSPSVEDEGFAHFMDFAERARGAQQAVNDLGAGPPSLEAQAREAIERAAEDREHRRAAAALRAFYRLPDGVSPADYEPDAIASMRRALDAAQAFTIAEARAGIGVMADAIRQTLGVQPAPEPQRWRDNQGDVWTLGDDGLLHTPETAPFPVMHVERKWGPLVPLPPEEAPRA